MNKFLFIFVLSVMTLSLSTQSFAKISKTRGIKRVSIVETVKDSVMESKTVVEKKEKLKTSVGLQQATAITEDIKNKFNISQKTLNISANYQWKPETSFSILIPYHMETGDNNSPNVTDETKTIAHKYVGKIELGVNQELFTHSTVGAVSGMVNLVLPTMSGYTPKLGYEFFNHREAHFGVKNKLSLVQWPVSILGSLIYKAKSATTLEDKIVDFGDEIVASVGGKYSFAHSQIQFLNPVSSYTELQYAQVAPVSVKTIPEDEKQLITTQETRTGAFAVKLNERMNYAYSANTSIYLDSQFALMRSALPQDGNKLAPLWGSVENSADMSIQLGVTFGIL